MLSPPQKYDLWFQLARQEMTRAEAAAEHRMDSSTIMRIRTLAKVGALAAPAASKPGRKGREPHYEFEQAKAENERLSGGKWAVRIDTGGGLGSWT